MINLSKCRSFWNIIPYLFNYIQNPPQKYANPNYKINSRRNIAIYCIHGTGDRYNAFAKAAKYMQAKLPDCFSGIHLVKFYVNSKHCGISTYAEQLINKIYLNEDKEVILIGHSSGGLVASYAAENLSRKYGIAVRMVIAIASPYRGTWWAKLPALNQFSSIKKMQTSNDFLIELSKQIKQSHSGIKKLPDNITIFQAVTKYVFVGAQRDKIVANNAFLPFGIYDTESIYRFPYDGHLSILLNTDLYDVVLKQLNLLRHEIEKSSLSL